MNSKSFLDSWIRTFDEELIKRLWLSRVLGDKRTSFTLPCGFYSFLIRFCLTLCDMTVIVAKKESEENKENPKKENKHENPKKENI